MATITRVGSKWRIRKSYNGIIYSTYTDKKPSEKQAEKIILEIIKDSTDSKPSKNMTVKKACESYNDIKESVLSESTIAGYDSITRNLPQWLSVIKLGDITEEHLQRYVNELSKRLSPKTVINRYGYLHDVLALYRPKFHAKISLPRKLNKEIYIPVDEDIKKLFQKISGSKYEVAIHLAALGLRKSEIGALSFSDLEGNILHITKSKVKNRDKEWVVRCKNKTEAGYRDIVLPDYLVHLIRQNGSIYDGSPDSISDYLVKTLAELHITHFSLHKLRHYYASISHHLGVADAYIMLTGGWKSDYVLKTIYRHAMQDKAMEQQMITSNHIAALYSNSDI